MPGFRVSNYQNISNLKNYDTKRCISDKISSTEGILFERNTLNKFMNDKTLLETNDNVFILEGVIYNLLDLCNQYNVNKLDDLLPLLFEKFNIEFLKELRGFSSGVVLDKKEKKLYVFTSQLGEKAVYYYKNAENIVFGSQLNYITDLLKEKNIVIKPDTEAMNRFLGFGYNFGTDTCALEIKRIYPGNYMVYDLAENSLSEQIPYYIAENVLYECSEKEAILKLDSSFKNAILDILNKNKEYGYKTIVDLSAGADSRMIAYTVKEFVGDNTDDIIAINFGQTGCADVEVAQEIANQLNFDLIHYSLDSAKCCMDIDGNIFLNNGNVLYCTITGGKRTLEILDREQFGLEITGLLGDVYDGSMVTNYPAPLLEDMERYRYSNTLQFGTDFVSSKEKIDYFKRNPNEVYWLYQRGMIFGMTSYFIRQNYTEVATPFGDPIFMKYYLSFPWDTRVKNFLLRKWLIEKYPKAAEFTYSDSGISIRESIKVDTEDNKRKEIREKIKKLFPKVLVIYRKLRDCIIQTNTVHSKPIGMNDMNYWYNNNVEFKNYIDTYLSDENINVLPMEIMSNINKMLVTNKIFDKLIVASLISIVKTYIK